ncbi:MAG TPA: ATP-binding protein [Chroococcales cyanobacterium]
MTFVVQRYAIAQARRTLSAFLRLRNISFHCSLLSAIELPQEELSRIFELFHRIPKNDPWKQGGTSLGLALVRKLVNCLRGTIEATSDRVIFQVCDRGIDLPLDDQSRVSSP